VLQYLGGPVLNVAIKEVATALEKSTDALGEANKAN